MQLFLLNKSKYINKDNSTKNPQYLTKKQI